MHAHTHTTRAVAITDNCFARSGAHQCGKVIGVMNRVNLHLKNPLAYCRCECKVVYQAPAPHNTCGSCWLETAQQFYNDMRGEDGSRVTSKLKQGAPIHQRQFSHDMRKEGGSWVWCVCASCFNFSFENSDLNCSTA